MKKHILSITTALLILILFSLTTASANMLGDVNGDGKILSGDARSALRYSVGLEPLTAEQIKAADVNCDGKVLSADARSILRASVGLETLHTHSYTGAVTTAATCTANGVKTFTCSCGDSYTEVITATGHKEVKDAAKTATCTATGLTEGKHCSECHTIIVPQTVLPATGHKDSNKDHICDKGCGIKQGNHSDTGKDHICDYGCSELIGTCADTNKDHKCDYGCNKAFGEHKDDNTDHSCDYGCSVAIGTHEDTDKDHDCEYGCSEAVGTHEDTDEDHDCEYGCSEAIGACEDTNKDHTCDYGCDKAFGEHKDDNTDHSCDYGCSEAIGNHEDTDKNHTCEYGCSEAIGAHADSATDNDHVCDYDCGEAIEDCTDGDDTNHNCDICNKENVSEHDWTDASCTVAKTCSVCDEVDGEPLGHTGGYPTCSTPATCDVCETVYFDEDNHEEFSWEVVDPSCTLNGYAAYHCTGVDPTGKECTYFKTEGMQEGDAAPGHAFGDIETIPPTCTEQGYDIKVCSRCDADEKSNFEPATGHDYIWDITKPASCKETGLRTGECSVCHDTIENEVINRTACKEFKIVLVESGSRSEHNIEIIKCTVCEKEQSRSELHQMRSLKTTISEWSCTSHEITLYGCFACDYTEERITKDMEGHKLPKDPGSYDATCEEPGLYIYSGNCLECHADLNKTEVEIPKLGHIKKEGTMQTCTTSELCATCKKPIPGKEALGHDFSTSAAAFNNAEEIQHFFCNRCGAANENTLDVFNTLANNIKTNSYFTSTRSNKVYTASKTSTNMTYSRFDFGMFTSSFKEEFDNMANEPDKYTRLSTTGTLTRTLPIQSFNTVSSLRKQDIENITAEKLNGINIGDVLSEFNPTNQQHIELLRKYKDTSIPGDIIKVTINVNNEKYNDIKDKPNPDTSLSKIYNYDIISSAKLALEDFKGDNGLEADGIEFTVDLKEFSTDAKVTYYFKADTFDPIIALYDIGERAEIKADITIPLGLINFNGGFDPDITMTTTNVYIFPYLFN